MAGFDGNTFSWQYLLSPDFDPAYDGPILLTGGPGIELGFLVPRESRVGSYDFDGSTITVYIPNSSFSSFAFNGFQVFDSGDVLTDITGFTITSNNTLSSAPAISFDANNLFVNFTGTSASGGTIVFSVQFGPSINVVTGATPGHDRMNGTTGADLFDGLTGRDTMTGGDGDDTYVVDSSDRVIEGVGGGTDTVQTALSIYNLHANVEHLEYIGTGAFKGTGNAENNHITGRENNDTLVGGDGDDTLIGADGSDTYRGGIGADVFVIGQDVSIPPQDEYDTVLDFNGAQDLLHLEQTFFTNAVLAGSNLAAGDLFVGKLSAANGGQHFIYDAAGNLYYDADGAGIGAGAEQIAKIANKAALAADDFVFV